MFDGILKIALLCVLIGSASIPISFNINDNPFVVWFGNALGSVFSAAIVVFVGERITSQSFKQRISKRRLGRKIVKAFDEGNSNKSTIKTRDFINKHGLRLFALLCPIFPGVLVSTTAVYLLELDRKIYKRWLFVGVFFVSGAYVFGYWFLFRK